MKRIALIPLCLLGCGLPEPPASGPPDVQPDASASLPPEEQLDPIPDAGPRVDAERAGQVLTQTTSSLIEPDISIACNDDNGIHSENSYYRVFDLAAAGITSTFHVTKVEVGVETADGGDDGVQPVEVRLHTLTGELLIENLTSLATVSQVVPATIAGRLTFDFDATVPAGVKLAVEVHTPDGQQGGDSFFIGANNDGQTAPGYLRAPECDDQQPTDLAQIGFADMHILIDVTGN